MSDMSWSEIAEHNAERARRRELRAAAARLLDAELLALTAYDLARQGRGHDYGNGQRYRELGRLARELEHTRRFAEIDGATAGELIAPAALVLETARAIAAKRLARYRSEPHLTSTAQRAEAAWREAIDELNRGAE